MGLGGEATMIRFANKCFSLLALFTLLRFGALPSRVLAADKLVGISFTYRWRG